MLAALYVQKDGCYYGLDDVDPWDEERDARGYPGLDAVVCHPPCQRWGKMARVNYARWGGEHNKPGNDGGRFAHAVRMVNQYASPGLRRAAKHCLAVSEMPS